MHTVRCISPTSVVWQCKLVPGSWLKKLMSALLYGLGKYYIFFTLHSVYILIAMSSMLLLFYIQRCRFCDLRGASVGCFVKSCRMSFHFPCGLENGVLAQYFGTFRYLVTIMTFDTFL